MKNIKKRLAAAALAMGLALGASVVAAPAARATGGLGTGVVDIYGYYPGGSCDPQNPVNCFEGAGVVVDNPWSTNEVLTAWHVVAGLDPAHIFIYDPYTETTQLGYIQKHDAANDLAVLWIYQSYSPQHGFTASPYTFATLQLAADSSYNGGSVFSEGDHNSNWEYPGQLTFDTASGTILNNRYNGPNGTGFRCGSAPPIYNVIRTTYMTAPGDSGGPLFATSGYDSGLVIGLNDCSDLSGHNVESEAIQAAWAWWDMLHTFPTGG